MSDEFWARVDKRDSGCWHWTGPMNDANGCARGAMIRPLPLPIGGELAPRRIAWALVNWPPSAHLMRLCAEPRCVNPEHMQHGGDDWKKGEGARSLRRSPSLLNAGETYAFAVVPVQIAAARVARQYGVEHWTEDLAQESLLLLHEAERRGIKGGQRMFRFLALQALSRIFRVTTSGQPRLAMERHACELTADRAISRGQGDRELPARAIALWRLQELWPDLTGKQQTAMRNWLSGETEKVSTTQIRQVVMAKINREAHPVRQVTDRHAARNAGILAMLDEGKSLAEVGRCYGLTKQRVYKIRNEVG